LAWFGWLNLFLSFISGASFIVALYFLYAALSKGEASKTLVLVGSFTPVFSFVFSLFLGTTFTSRQLLGMAMLVAGALLIAIIRPRNNFFQRLFAANDNKNSRTAILFSLISALFYSFYFLISKQVYSSGFVSGFIWIRIMVVGLIAASFLFVRLRRLVFEDVKNMKRGTGNSPFLMVFNQIVGALGFILQNLAISLGAVAVVNALQGFQYGFLIISTSLLSRFFSKVFPREKSLESWIKKILAIVFISFGLYFIY
jgi:drug/metabolite transporter (DMT)-like permease